MSGQRGQRLPGDLELSTQRTGEAGPATGAGASVNSRSLRSAVLLGLACEPLAGWGLASAETASGSRTEACRRTGIS